ncbi:ribulose-5-phosphate 3-epimerase [Clostridium cavendishii DSM 21758]|uniref:Ribulose-phosphate 3-epimerase n=1 Tax=Clostridium cavendishii DSM 21758 TaxID=1121302 RepID=A0A1M6K999_9CLOT|nr:ribulose-phosphate 3-epimerase [Clostridium cavendishii]SHJ55460.1 ribulose-5-phosphate 3-epimerase [Clostridium cavendishii DSM 21758]
MVKIAPSMLSADFLNLGDQIKRVEKGGADFLHIDVMDGRFVPNISFGFPLIKPLRKITNLIFDVHLMIEEPSKYIDEFVASGADIITVHYEADRHIHRTISYIKSKGIKAGVSLNPGTPVSVLKDIIEELDMVLIMSVNPGFGGQSFIKNSLEKIKEVKELAIRKSNKDILIQVDGGIDSSNAKLVTEAGANVLVAGSAVFKNDEIEKNIKAIREVI